MRQSLKKIFSDQTIKPFLILTVMLFCFLGVFTPLSVGSEKPVEANQVSAMGLAISGDNGAATWFTDFVSWIAGGLIGTIEQLVAEFIEAIFLVFQKILAFVLTIVAAMAQATLNFAGFMDNPIVKVGWEFARDIANLLFVFVILIAAIATVLRIESYGVKKILPTLIAVALLVNFSLPICGAIVDFTQVTANFFIDEQTDVFMSLTDGLQVSSWQNREFWNYDAEKPDVLIATILVSLFSIVFYLAAILIFLLATMFFLIRIIYLWILVIMAPLAWITVILPNTKHLFSQWWKSFLKWSFFAPLYVFFLYLVVFAISSGAVTDLANSNNGMAKGLVALILNFIILLGIMVGGLVAAQQLSIAGASTAISIAKYLPNKTKEWTKSQTQQQASRATRKAGEQADRFATKAKTGQGVGAKAAKYSGAGFIAGQAGRGARSYTQKEKEAMLEAEKKYKNMSSADIKSNYKSSDARTKAALSKILAERGDLEKDLEKGFTESDIKQSIKLNKRYNTEKELLKSRPDLTESPEEGAKIIKDMKPEDMGKIQLEAIQPKPEDRQEVRQTKTNVKNEIVNKFKQGGKGRPVHLSKMQESNQDLATEMQPEFEKEFNNLREDIKSYLNTDAGKAVMYVPSSSSHFHLHQEKSKEQEKDRMAEDLTRGRPGPSKVSSPTGKKKEDEGNK